MLVSVSCLFISERIINLKSVNSTNDYAHDLIAKSNPIEGTTVITEYQTAGKGQIGRIWESEAGKNLMLTIILKPEFLPLEQQFLLNVISSLSVLQCLKSIGLKNLFVKWPNDIYVKNKKICGILIQGIIKGKKLSHAILGIGINVNQISFSNKLVNPSSVALELGYKILLERVKKELFRSVELLYSLLKSGKMDDLTKEYISHLYLRGEVSKFLSDKNIPFEGVIKGIDIQGRLHIESQGEDLFFLHNSIKYL